jgi:hypothetical protein
MGKQGTVGTTKIFENDKIILWEFSLAPGEQTPLHTHEHDYLFYVLDGAPLQVLDADGNDLGTMQANAGDAFPLRVEGEELVSIDDKGHRVPRTHIARNAGSTPYREVLVEWK